MADETVVTRIVANADFSSLIADVHKVTASLSKLQEKLANSNKMLANQIAVMNRSFADTMRSTGQFSTHFVSLQSDVEKFGKNLDGGRLKLRDYFGTFQQHVKTSGGLIRDLAKQQVALQNAVLQPLGRNAQGLMQFNVHVPRGLNEVANKTAIARQELQIMNRVIQDGAVQLINWGKNTQWAGRQLTVGLTLPLTIFGKAAADAFRTADQELTRLTKVYGDVAGTSAQELSKVRKEVSATAQELASAMGVNFQETIGLAADIAATGKTGNELLSSVSETTRLAVLGEVDRQEAMKATLAIQSAFKQNTEELADSINFLNAVENQTSTTLNDLVEAIPKAGPVIKGLGGSIQDLALYLTAMREGGINASEGANALKSALASLINPTDVAVGKFESFGIDLMGIVNDNAGNTTKTLFALQAALDRLDPLQKQQAIEQLFGKFQFSRLNALFENLGRQGSQTLQVLDLMNASAGELEEVASRELAAVTESAAGQYRRAVEGLKAELATVGEEFLKINTIVVKGITKVLDFINNLPKPIKQILTFLGGLTAIAGPLIMLTGVLANFFGYIIKGVMHFKALFKGAEGWKYLTPEMLAAEKAGKLVEQTFYSDAKAAAVLQQALRNLLDEFALLEAKAKSGAISINPAVSTMAGNMVAGAAIRVADPNNPLAGAYGTRASTHMVPRGSMTEEQRLAQTIFGMVPGAIPVNQKIGANPQIYMNEPLPNVPGVTTINGVSTGVVAGEAAKWHAMMATLAMQSKEEIEELKGVIATTQTVSSSFMNQFDDVLPVVSDLTNNAAKLSAGIVADLRNGKITVENAKAQIIALNLETERMIAEAVGTQAALMGRTINPTVVPTLNQPVVNAAGKSNMRELFKKGKTRDFINRVASSLGVRTSGAGYNIQTTRPKRMSEGGVVYKATAGRIGDHPGSPRGTDTIPAWLTEGEYVIRASQVTPETLPILESINGGGRPEHLSAQMLWQTTRLNQGLEGRSAPGEELMPLTGRNIAREYRGLRAAGLPPVALLYDAGIRLGYSPEKLRFHLNNYEKALAQSVASRGNTPLSKRELEIIQENLLRRHADQLWRVDAETGKKINFFSETELMGSRRVSGKGGSSFIGRLIRPLLGTSSGFKDRQNEAHLLRAQELLDSPMHTTTSGQTIKQMFGVERGHLGSRLWGSAKQIASRMGMLRRGIRFPRRMNNGGMVYMNDGGLVPGYFGGGIVREARQKGFFGQSLLQSRGDGAMSPMAGIGVGMGMQMAGSMIGGPAGTILQMASVLPMITPGGLTKVLGIVPKILTGFTSMTKIIGTIRSGLILLTRAIPGAAVIAGIYGIVKAFQTWRKNVEETRRENIMLTGMTEKGAEELGIKYNNMSDSIQNVTEKLKLQREQGRAAFESFTSAGVTGLTLTIKQLKELKARVKEDMPEIVGTFNSLDSSQVQQFADNLKAQMISSGKSVQEATNTIYALIEASNKAGMGVGTIISQSFNKIVDSGSAVQFMLNNVKSNLDKINETDPEAFASGIDNLIGTLDSSIKALVGTKDSTGKVITQAKALSIQFDRIAASGLKNRKLGAETLTILQKQRPEFAAILNSADTIGGMYAKWRLLLDGVRTDLSLISSKQAETLALFQEGLDQAAESALTNIDQNNELKAAATALKKLNESIKTLDETAIKAQKGKIGLNKQEIKTIQDQIKAIRDRAEAKKRALREEFDTENTQLEIQKAQLEYQQALARGDKDAAAAAQLRIEQLNKEFQLRQAEKRIDDNARKEEAKLAKVLEADQELKDALASAGQGATSKADTLKKERETISNLATELTRIAKAQANVFAMPDDTKAQRKAKQDALEEDVVGPLKTWLSELEKSAKDSARVRKAFADYLVPDAQGNPTAVARGADPSKKITSPTGNTYTSAEGSALTELGQLATQFSSFAETLLGKKGKTLSDIYDILANPKNPDKKTTIDLSTEQSIEKLLDIKYPDSYTPFIQKNGKATTELRSEVLTDIVNKKKLKEGDVIKGPNGIEYVVTVGEDSWFGTASAKRKSLGGIVAAGERLIVNDRINSLGAQQEGFMPFIPSVSGKIYPNINTMPRYNIPTNSISGINGMPNESSSNIVYNIDIDLNGTNVTADDIMRRFKAELALINAKEGRVRTVGGTY